MKVCVFGAGTMGAGIAQVMAAAGNPVILCDIDLEHSRRGKQQIADNLARQVNKGKMDAHRAENLLQRITATDDMILAAHCELVIEAIKEEMNAKTTLLSKLHLICDQETLFASNTSSLSITEMSAKSGRPIVGMHFFNPVPVMELVEVIAGLNTPAQSIDQVVAIVKGIGKIPIIVQDSSGFVVNRLLIPMINEAVFILAEGVASAKDIDEAMKLGANYPIGPLSLADLIGNDIVLAIMETLLRDTGDQKYRPAPLLRKMVLGGLLGKKSGRGFFNYKF